MEAPALNCPSCTRSLAGQPVNGGRVTCAHCGSQCVIGSAPDRRPPPQRVISGSNPTGKGRQDSAPEESGDDTIDAFAPALGTQFEPLPPGWVAPFSREFLEGHHVMGILGKGAMGAVYLMRQVKLDRLVAVKVVREDLLSSDEARRLEKEARVLASLNHPNILALYDVGNDAGKPYMVCEYVEGETLSRRIARKPALTLVQSLRIILQVLEGLKAAHKKQVVHRDLKPGNILLTSNARPKIGDFGLAKSHTLASGTLAGRIVGTPPYMSPEQCRGSAVTFASDLYSVGCILFELAAGRRPFTGPDTADYLTQHTMEQPPPLRSINPALPVELERIVQQALSKDPARRFDSARTFRKELIDLYRSLAPQADTPVLTPQPAERDPRVPDAPPLKVPAQLQLRTGEVTAGTLMGKRYRVLRLIGEGGMGQVWLASDEAMDGTEVALKILPGEMWRDAEARETLKLEAKTSQKLAHPNIVRLMTLEPGEPPFLVMEFINGPTLAADLATRKRKGLGPYTPAEALPVLEGVASGLDHAHSKNLVHRDLKPSNVMLDPQPDGSLVAKLADFGIAAEIANYRTRQTGAVPAGTLAYMSPEQLACQKLDGRADVYSLGATLYQMLTLQPPFVGGDIAWAIRNEPVPEPADVPAPVVAVLMASLAKNREDRPGTPGELAVRLRDAVQQLPPSRPGIGTAVPLDPGQQPWAVEEGPSSAGNSGAYKRTQPDQFRSAPDPRTGAPARGGYSRPEPQRPAPGAGAGAANAAVPLPPWTLEAYALAALLAGGWIVVWLNAGLLTDGTAVARVALQLFVAAAALASPVVLLWMGSDRVRKVALALHGTLLLAGGALWVRGLPELAPWALSAGLAGVFLLTRAPVRAYCTGLRPDGLDLRAYHRRTWALVVGAVLALAGAHAARLHLQALAPERLPAALWISDAVTLAPRAMSPDGAFSLQPPAGWQGRFLPDGTLGFVLQIGRALPLGALSIRREPASGAGVDIAGATARLVQRRRRFDVEIERAGVVNINPQDQPGRSPLDHTWTEVLAHFRVQGGVRSAWYFESVKNGIRYEIEVYGIPGFIAANRPLWHAVLNTLELTTTSESASSPR